VRVILTAFVLSLTGSAFAQSGVEITMPRVGHQVGGFPFANKCGTDQTFEITAEPPAAWLDLQPRTVDVRASSSFDVQAKVNTTGNLPFGTYQSSVRIICATCAVNNPPCLQQATEVPVRLIVAEVAKPGAFTPIVPLAAPAATAEPQPKKPAPIVTLEMPAHDHPRLIAILAFAFLFVGLMAGAVALLGLSSRNRTPRFAGPDQQPAETDRHRVRR
jgi:hypothetical protein